MDEMNDYPGLLKNLVRDELNDYFKRSETDDLHLRILPSYNLGTNSCINIRLSCEQNSGFTVKMPRYKNSKIASSVIKKEYTNISTLLKEYQMADFLPKTIGLYNISGVEILVTEYIDGNTLSEIIDNKTKKCEIEDILIKYSGLFTGKTRQSKTLPSFEISRDFISTYITAPAKAIIKFLPGHSTDLNSAIDSFFSRNDFSGLSMPSCLFHGDFSPGNLLIDKKNGQFFVIDWEDAEFGGLPMLDLFKFFLISMRVAMKGDTPSSQDRPLKEKISRAETVMKAWQTAEKHYSRFFDVERTDFLDLLFMTFILKNTLFFLDEKRRSIPLAENWLSLMYHQGNGNLFLGHMQKEIMTFKEYFGKEHG